MTASLSGMGIWMGGRDKECATKSSSEPDYISLKPARERVLPHTYERSAVYGVSIGGFKKYTRRLHFVVNYTTEAFGLRMLSAVSWVIL
jgi:hypothetical protein